MKAIMLTMDIHYTDKTTKQRQIRLNHSRIIVATKRLLHRINTILRVRIYKKC